VDGSFNPGKMASSVEDGVLTLQRRTYRSGDFVHVVFSIVAAFFAGMFLLITVANGTLFDGFFIPGVIMALAWYGYFGLTRLMNRRTVTIHNGHVTAKDGPLPQFVRSIDTSLEDLGPLSVKSSKRWTFPPISAFVIHNAHTQRGPDLFRRLPTEDEARYAVARIESFARPPGSKGA
jgi:hypothetical protein